MIASLIAQAVSSTNDLIANSIFYAGMSAAIIYLARQNEVQRKEITDLNKAYADDYVKLLIQDIEVVNKNSFMIESAPLNIKHQIHEEMEIFKKEIIELLKQSNS